MNEHRISRTDFSRRSRRLSVDYPAESLNKIWLNNKESDYN